MDAALILLRAVLLMAFLKATGLLRWAYEALLRWHTLARFWFHGGAIRRVVGRGGLVAASGTADGDRLGTYDCLLDGKVFKTVSRGGRPDVLEHARRRAAVRAGIMAVMVQAAPGHQLSARELGRVSSFVQERACGFQESRATVAEVLRLAEAACGLQPCSVENAISVVAEDFSQADFADDGVIRL
jgi:hypothetical protein